jgi:hypothetical protein
VVKEVEKENKNHALEQKRKGIQKEKMADARLWTLHWWRIGAIAKKRNEAQSRP